MNRNILLTAAFFGLTSIILGAFGAHALKEILSVNQLQTFETGVRYQMYHALFLLFLGTYQNIGAKAKRATFYLVTIGTVLFSGSIYVLATNAIPALNKIAGPVTPVGGLLLIIGWAVVFLAILKRKS